MNIIITAGGTTEKIDDVRSISNSSTGRLGSAIAQAFIKSDNFSGCTIYYICGQNAVVPPSDKITPIRIGGVGELVSQIENIMAAEEIDIFIHSMAVSDYTVKSVTTKNRIQDSIKSFFDGKASGGYGHRQDSSGELAAGILSAAFDGTSPLNSSGKISSDMEDLIIEMKRTPKVIGMIKKLCPQVLLVGFKLLSSVDRETLIDVAYDLLKKNSCDLVLANDLAQITKDRHTGYLISEDKSYERLETKEEIALAVVNRVTVLLSERNKERK